MSLESRDSRKSNCRARRLSSSSIMSEEDKNNIGFLESMSTEDLYTPHTAIIRRTETRCLKTNQTTGIKIAEQCAKNLSMMTSVRQQLVTQKECMKLGSTRPITSRGQRDRHFHGIRHFQGVLHSKIRDLTFEIEKLHWRCNDAQQEYINSLTYESKAKVLASEITNFQKNLADLNLAFDYVNRIGVIEEVEQEVQQLEELNLSEKGRIEGLFNERKLKEDFVHQIDTNEHIRNIQNSTNPGVSDEKERYIDFNNRLTQSTMAVGFWDKQIEQYKKVKDSLTQKLKAKFPFMDDIIGLEVKLLNLKGKWNKVNENSTLRLNKDQELILEIAKQDRTEIGSIEYNLKSLTKQINNLQQVLDYLKSLELEIPNTDEPIDFYLSSFEDKKDSEIKRLNLLESEITHYLSELKIELPLIPTINDYLNLNENNRAETDISDSKDFQEEHHGAFSTLKKLNIMDVYLSKDSESIDEKSKKLKYDLEEYKSQKKVNDKFKKLECKLKNEILQLEENKRTHLMEQKMAKAHLGKLEKEISENAKHEELLTLEKKQSNLEEDIILMNQSVEEMKISTTQLLEIRAKTLNLMGMINSELINHCG